MTNREMSFEDAMARLEQIVASLDGGDLPLDEALKMFTEGSRLAKFCASLLDNADAKLEMLVTSDGGEPELVPADSLLSAREGA